MSRRWRSETNRQLQIECDAHYERQQTELREQRVADRNFRDSHPRETTEFDRDRNGRETGIR